jgi:hypothetical protein
MLGMKEIRVSTQARNPADDCIEACTWAELACLACAEMCLNDVPNEELSLCVQLSLDCAEICWTTRKFVTDALVVAPQLVREQLDQCALACAACAAECRRHAATLSELATCEQSCARCEQLCRSMQLRVTKLD